MWEGHKSRGGHPGECYHCRQGHVLPQPAELHPKFRNGAHNVDSDTTGRQNSDDLRKKTRCHKSQWNNIPAVVEMAPVMLIQIETHAESGMDLTLR